jgi:hypothetical protein
MTEDDEFVPFLSSTENDYTDLNTEFNTERPLESEINGP